MLWKFWFVHDGTSVQEVAHDIILARQDLPRFPSWSSLTCQTIIQPQALEQSGLMIQLAVA